jgi:orotate phosphoribosyltransferase
VPSQCLPDIRSCRDEVAGLQHTESAGVAFVSGGCGVRDDAPVQSTLGQDVYAACHLTGEFTLRSGQVSSEYFDKYLFESEPLLLRRVAEVMATLLPPCDVLAGMEMGGIPIVTVLSQLTGLPCIFVRKEAKAYGTCKIAEGRDFSGLRVVGVEDVVTTAGALIRGCQALRGAGADLDTVVCAIDREQGGAANLKAEGIELRAALRRSDLAPA